MVEVETKILLKDKVSDPEVRSIPVPKHGYLQTSPEYEMKKILSKCNLDIYQVCKVFRDDENSYIHNKEFRMLELYRLRKKLSNTNTGQCYGIWS